MLNIGDRTKCFYWQTDRNLSIEDYQKYFLIRHSTPKKELVQTLQNGIKSILSKKDIVIDEPDENIVMGNVNIVRKVTINGKPYVVRMHPKGIRNEYFYVEKLAQNAAIAQGIPVPRILEIHEARDEKDMDFTLVSALSGVTMVSALLKDPSLEQSLLFQLGVLLAKIHEIKVEKYGSFDNNVAKIQKRLVGLHTSYRDFIWCGLEENLQRLIHFGVISKDSAQEMKDIFEKITFEPVDGPRLIHNDYADWNILVDGKNISGILDWDECHAGDPIADLACWSTFFDIARMKELLKGYRTIKELPEDYDTRFHYYRLRYSISKMALRIKRAQIDPQPSVLDKIKLGRVALKEEQDWFASYQNKN